VISAAWITLQLGTFLVGAICTLRELAVQDPPKHPR
jgi:hypothetical protein